MKRKAGFTLLFIAMCLAWALSAFSVSAAPNYKKIYGACLSNGSVAVRTDWGSEVVRMNHFLLLDIDRNGTKELLTYDWDCYSVEIFTIENGGLKYIGSFFNKYGRNEVTYNKKRKGLITPSGGGGYLGYYMTGLKNGKLYDKCSVLTENMRIKRYLVNGKYVSKKKADKYNKKYFSEKDKKTYYFHNNTAKNRKAFLK